MLKNTSTRLLYIQRLYQFKPVEQITLYFTQLMLQRPLGCLNGFTFDRGQQQQPVYIFDFALILNDVYLLPE
jgi:hypothetical protein